MQTKQIYHNTALALKRASFSNDFAITLIGALVLVALISANSLLWFLGPLRLLLGVAYVLYVPGYWLTAALFASADDLDTVERVGLSLGLSVAIVPILALLLDRLPWGLRLWPIMLGELGLIIIAMLIVTVRRALLPNGLAFEPMLRLRPRSWWRGLPQIERRIYPIVAGVLLLAALALAWVLLVPTPDTYTTEFYMLGEQGRAEEYPREVGLGQDVAVTLGMVNSEREAHNYHVELWVVDTWQSGQRQRVGQTSAMHLVPCESRQWPITWRMPWAGNDQRVELLLFEDGTSTPYRRLEFWINVRAGVPSAGEERLP